MKEWLKEFGRAYEIWSNNDLPDDKIDVRSEDQFIQDYRKDHPLSLPSDEEIEVMADNLADGCDSPHENFITGAKWMRSKLEGKV